MVGADVFSNGWKEGSLVDGRFTLTAQILCNEDVVLWNAYDRVEEGNRILVEQAPGLARI